MSRYRYFGMPQGGHLLVRVDEHGWVTLSPDRIPGWTKEYRTQVTSIRVLALAFINTGKQLHPDLIRLARDAQLKPSPLTVTSEREDSSEGTPIGSYCRACGGWGTHRIGCPDGVAP